MLTSQYAPTTGQAFGFGLEHIADGTIHMWMDNVETAKEVRRWLIIKKMRMTNHATRAFKVKIEPGKGLELAH
jgi:KaiC/GvpD/RAD55 family RecA-like ATPase